MSWMFHETKRVFLSSLLRSCDFPDRFPCPSCKKGPNRRILTSPTLCYPCGRQSNAWKVRLITVRSQYREYRRFLMSNSLFRQAVAHLKRYCHLWYLKSDMWQFPHITYLLLLLVGDSYVGPASLLNLKLNNEFYQVFHHGGNYTYYLCKTLTN